jgi:hypothetical protein
VGSRSHRDDNAGDSLAVIDLSNEEPPSTGAAPNTTTAAPGATSQRTRARRTLFVAAVALAIGLATVVQHVNASSSDNKSRARSPTTNARSRASETTTALTGDRAVAGPLFARLTPPRQRCWPRVVTACGAST